MSVKKGWIDGIIDDVARDMEKLFRDVIQDLTDRVAARPKTASLNDPEVEPAPVNGGLVLVRLGNVVWRPEAGGWTDGVRRVGWPKLCSLANSMNSKLVVFDERR